MTATATIEKKASAEASTSEEQRRLVHRSVCAYLKGYIVGYSVLHGMKWDGDAERTEPFARGFQDSRCIGSKTVTFAHVIYNRVRHDRPHLGRKRRDEEFRRRRTLGNKLLAVLAEYGLDVKEVLG